MEHRLARHAPDGTQHTSAAIEPQNTIGSNAPGNAQRGACTVTFYNLLKKFDHIRQNPKIRHFEGNYF